MGEASQASQVASLGKAARGGARGCWEKLPEEEPRNWGLPGGRVGSSRMRMEVGR